MTKKQPGKYHPSAHFISYHQIPLLKELRLRELDEEYIRQLKRLRHILDKVKRKHATTTKAEKPTGEPPSKST